MECCRRGRGAGEDLAKDVSPGLQRFQDNKLTTNVGGLHRLVCLETANLNQTGAG